MKGRHAGAVLAAAEHMFISLPALAKAVVGAGASGSVVDFGCPLGCSSHGTCVSGSCSCSPGWTGQDCSFFLTGTSDFGADDLETAADVATCLDGCLAHGSCVDGVCHCQEGWEGGACNVQKQCSPRCAAPGGRCTKGTCHCAVGFFGPDCIDKLCPHDCWGHGECAQGTCACFPGWFGQLCASRLDDAGACDPPCATDSGQCIDGACQCHEGFEGVDCSQPAPPPIPAALASAEDEEAEVAALPSAADGAGLQHMQTQQQQPSLQTSSPAPQASSHVDDALPPALTAAIDSWHGGGPSAPSLPLQPPSDHVSSLSADTHVAVTAAMEPLPQLVATTAATAEPNVPPEADSESLAGRTVFDVDSRPGGSAQVPAIDANLSVQDMEAQVSAMEAQLRAMGQAPPPPRAPAATGLIATGSQGLNTSSRPKRTTVVASVHSNASAHINVTNSSLGDRLAETARSRHHGGLAREIGVVLTQEATNSSVEEDRPANDTVRGGHGALSAIKRVAQLAGQAADRLRKAVERPVHGRKVEGSFVQTVTWGGRDTLKKDAVGTSWGRSLTSNSNGGIRKRVRHSEDFDDEDSFAFAVANEGAEHQDKVSSSGTENNGVPASREVSLAVRRVSVNANATSAAGSSIGLPRGLGCDAECSGHGVCALMQNGRRSCSCDDRWVGLICDMPRCLDDCHAHGVCVEGQCVCGDAFFGESCQNERCPNDCSNNGYCFAGRCQCMTGWRGVSCSVMHVPPAKFTVHLKQTDPARAPPAIDRFQQTASLRAAPVKSCPADCHHRGVCSQRGKCRCYPGYSGDSCDAFCPNECSGQGNCIQGTCLCFAGYLGSDCSVKGCCSGHGSCDDPAVCVCDLGWGGYACGTKLQCPDPHCSGHGQCVYGSCHCTQGFGGPACNTVTTGCHVACGIHGMCEPETNTCVCAQGFTGETCDVPVHQCPKHCSNRGLCMNGICMCGQGWSGVDCSKRFFEPGTSLDQVAPKWSGLAVDTLIDGDTAMMQRFGMGGGGAGAAAGSAMAGRLAAESGMSGKICGEAGLCSGHGRCDTELARCVCDRLFSGSECEVEHCPGFAEVGLDCYGHGVCDAGRCTCGGGWGVAPVWSAFGSSPTAYLGPESCKDRVCAGDCGFGRCVNGACQCKQGWTGPNCKDPKCLNDCSGHGQCTFSSPNNPGECVCVFGYSGAACERVALYMQMQSCPNDCSGNGLCMDGRCDCNVGFTGLDCSELSCSPGTAGPHCEVPTCPNNCFGQGLCLGGQCACWEDFVGTDCSVPLHCSEQCSDDCDIDATTQACVICVGQCTTALINKKVANANSAHGAAAGLMSHSRHSPYYDLETTLLQAGHRGGHRRSRNMTATVFTSTDSARAGANQGQRLHTQQHQQRELQQAQPQHRAQKRHQRLQRSRPRQHRRHRRHRRQQRLRSKRHHVEVNVVRLKPGNRAAASSANLAGRGGDAVRQGE
eukprot:TRINITY_DN19210_c0_g1_i3.p1 TRINITY_DN19210_c0_g1~~TRINITY_DN19210_c0_g1_i3.p1  ORF type:complete len:1457 (-),score=239.98 TRINITY_DN19210_c0_g1_i3:93-4463(-)